MGKFLVIRLLLLPYQERPLHGLRKRDRDGVEALKRGAGGGGGMGQ